MRLASLGWALPIAALAACESGGSPSLFATQIGSSVLVDDNAAVVVESRPGVAMVSKPTGGACDPARLRYELDLATGDLAWNICNVAGTGSSLSDFMPASGSRTLATGDRDRLRDAVAAVKVAPVTGCLPDRPSLSIQIRVGEAWIIYSNSVDGCSGTGRYFVDSIALDALASLLFTLDQ